MSEGGEAWIITGLSGAGKATALAALARAGADVHDNLPVALLADWAALPRTRVAVATVDARQGEAIRDFASLPGVRVLYLDADDSVLLRRLGDSTAPHPSTGGRATVGAIAQERELLTAMRAAADSVIDSSTSTASELGERVCAAVLGEGGGPAVMRLTVSSFGFKHGPQAEADWVIDVRFLRNPFWDPQLRPHTGLEPQVREYVLDDPASAAFCERVEGLLRWLLTQYAGHSRRFLHVAFGCTGGRHRSVVIAEEMARRLGGEGLEVDVRHRDVELSDPR